MYYFCCSVISNITACECKWMTRQLKLKISMPSCRRTNLGSEQYSLDGICSEDRLQPGLLCCGNRPFNPETTTCCKVHDGHSVAGQHTVGLRVSDCIYSCIYQFILEWINTACNLPFKSPFCHPKDCIMYVFLSRLSRAWPTLSWKRNIFSPFVDQVTLHILFMFKIPLP